MIIEAAIHVLFALSAGLAGYVIMDSLDRWIRAYRTIRKQLEEIKGE